MSNTLKPCPFCGHEAVIDDCGDYQYFVRCTHCSINQDKLYAQRYDAVRAWNRRVNDEKMTNREYLDSLSNMDFANFIYSKLLKIGKEYTDSVLGIAHWLGLEKSFENVVSDEPLSPIRDYCVDYTSETL